MVKTLYCEPAEQKKFRSFDCVKIVRIRSFSGPYFPAFGLNTEKYGVPLRIQSKYGKIRVKKTPNTDTFHPVFLEAECKIILQQKKQSCRQARTSRTT